MFQIPAHEPEAFVAGDTVQWTKSLRDFAPSDGWALKYRLTNALLDREIPASAITVVTNDPGSWSVTIPASASGVPAGVWRLVGWVLLTATGERHVVYDRAMTILADATSTAAMSLLTPNEQILAAIDARLLGRVTADQEQVTINGTALTRIPIEKLQTLRGVHAAKVWREQNPGRSNPVHKMRFGRVR